MYCPSYYLSDLNKLLVFGVFTRIFYLCCFSKVNNRTCNICSCEGKNYRCYNAQIFLVSDLGNDSDLVFSRNRWVHGFFAVAILRVIEFACCVLFSRREFVYCFREMFTQPIEKTRHEKAFLLVGRLNNKITPRVCVLDLNKCNQLHTQKTHVSINNKRKTWIFGYLRLIVLFELRLGG